jgi:hypothetical protein
MPTMGRSHGACSSLHGSRFNDLKSVSRFRSAPGLNSAAGHCQRDFCPPLFRHCRSSGRRFGHLGAERSDPGYEVVGVVRDAKYTDLRGEIVPTTYVPAANLGFVVFELRTAKSPTSIIPTVRSLVSQVDDNLPISNVVRNLRASISCSSRSD